MKKIYTVFFLLMTLCVINAQTSSIYKEKALEFDPGELIIIEAPDTETFEPLVFPSFRGKLRMGIQTAYQNTSGTWEDSKTRQRKKFLKAIFKNSYDVLREFMAIDVTRSTIDIAKMNSIYRPNNAYKNTDGELTTEIYWLQKFQALAGVTLTPKMYKKYLAPESKSWPYRPITPYDRGNTYKKGQSKWGGRSSDFEKVRIAKEFIDNEISKYLEWSKDLPNETYIVGKVILGDYNFDLGGFLIGLKAQGIGGTAMDKEQEQALFNTKLYPGKYRKTYATFVKMDPANAEAFTKKIEDKNGRRILYYIYQAKIEMQITKKNVLNPYRFNAATSLIQTPISKKIEFFKDLDLTEKVLELEF